MVKMKALRSFGVPGANEGKIRRGREFSAATDRRAKDLEDHSLAYRIEVRSEPRPLAIMEASPLNEAATSGPLPLAGGTTGAEEHAPSLPPALPPRKPRSKPSKVSSRSSR